MSYDPTPFGLLAAAAFVGMTISFCLHGLCYVFSSKRVAEIVK